MQGSYDDDVDLPPPPHRGLVMGQNSSGLTPLGGESDFSLASLSVSVGNMSVAANDDDGTSRRRTSKRTSGSSFAGGGAGSDSNFQAAVGNIMRWVKQTTAHTTQAAAAAAFSTASPSSATAAAAASNESPLQSHQHRHSLTTTLSSRSSQSRFTPPIFSHTKTSSNTGTTTDASKTNFSHQLKKDNSLGTVSVIISSRGEMFYDIMDTATTADELNGGGETVQLMTSLTSLASFEVDDTSGGFFPSPQPNNDNNANNDKNQCVLEARRMLSQQRSHAVRQLLIDTGAQLSPSSQTNQVSGISSENPLPQRLSEGAATATRRPSSMLSLMQLSERELNFFKEASFQSINSATLMEEEDGDVDDDWDDDGLAAPSTNATGNAGIADGVPNGGTAQNEEPVVYYKLVWQDNPAATPLAVDDDDDADRHFGLVGHKEHSLMSVVENDEADQGGGDDGTMHAETTDDDVFDDTPLDARGPPHQATSAQQQHPPSRHHSLPEATFYEDVEFSSGLAASWAGPPVAATGTMTTPFTTDPLINTNQTRQKMIPQGSVMSMASTASSAVLPPAIFYNDIVYGNDNVNDDVNEPIPLQPVSAPLSSSSALPSSSAHRHPPNEVQLPPAVYYEDVVFGTTEQLPNATAGQALAPGSDVPIDPPSFHSPITTTSSSTAATIHGANTIGSDGITDHDVLVVEDASGSGDLHCQHHAGNEVYAAEVAKRRERFAVASDSEKLAIRLDLMNCIKHQGGRFLKPDKKERNRWKVMDPKAVRTKATKDLSGIGQSEKCYIVGPVTDMDVLMGRGAHGVHHPGNQAYLAERDRLRPLYINAKTDDAKHQISKDLVHWVHARGGRFLKQDTNKQWYSMDNETVYEAAMQKLREDRKIGGSAM